MLETDCAQQRDYQTYTCFLKTESTNMHWFDLQTVIVQNTKQGSCK